MIDEYGQTIVLIFDVCFIVKHSILKVSGLPSSTKTGKDKVVWTGDWVFAR
jgi:hypothetical protein